MTGFTIKNSIPFDWDTFDRHFVGFDRVMDRLSQFNDQVNLIQKQSNYPPYNIKKTGDNTFVIEMAVAGFSKTDIELVLDDSKLTITGKLSSSSEGRVIYRGISNREFTRQFNLADTIEVKNADLIDGMLKVWLENIIPEHKKPKTIEIGSGEGTTNATAKPKSKKQLLSE